MRRGGKHQPRTIRCLLNHERKGREGGGVQSRQGRKAKSVVDVEKELLKCDLGTVHF